MNSATIEILDNLAVQAELIEKRRVALRGSTAAQLAEFYVEVRDVVDALEAELKRINLTKTELQQLGIPEAFDRESLKTITTKGGHRVTVSQLVRASMKDKEKGMEWLRGNDFADLIQPTVNASTLASMAKGLMEEGRELPEDIFSVHIANNTSVTKVKK